MFLETVRYLFAAYLLILAVGSLFGLGPRLLASPARTVYALIRLLVLVVSLGRLRMAPVAARGGSRVRSLRDSYRDWNEERKGERLLLGDDSGLEGGNLNWVSTAAGKPPPYPPGTLRAAYEAPGPDPEARPTIQPPASTSGSQGRPLIDIEPLDD